MNNFDAKKQTENIVRFIQKYYKDHNLGGAVLGISGGKDSAVVAGLMVKALGAENVKGLWLPCHSKDEDKRDAVHLADFLGIDIYERDLTEAYESMRLNMKTGLAKDTDIEYKDADINLKPRLRMAEVYYYAAAFSQMYHKPYIVPGTSNACELYVGYFTKGGDNVCDLKPIADLTVDEVIAVGDYLGLPYEIVHKTPDDGLSGMSDEEKLGVSYKEIAAVINRNAMLDEDTYNKIDKMHKNCQHKFNTATYDKLQWY